MIDLDFVQVKASDNIELLDADLTFKVDLLKEGFAVYSSARSTVASR